MCKTYNILTVTGDNYAGSWPKEAFARHGINYRTSDKVRSELYLAFLPLVNSQRVELLDHPKMVLQFQTLICQTGRSGKDVINHQDGGHDDICNAVSGALVLASVGAAPLAFHEPGLTHVPLGDVHQIGLPGVLAPAIYGDCSKPGGDNGAGAIGNQFSWSHTGLKH